METSWQNITRRLDLNKVEKDTTYAKSRAKGRCIKKVGTNLIIPAVTYNMDDRIQGLYIGQYNYTASSAFKILNVVTPVRLDGNDIASFYIRYRVGQTTYRYALFNSGLLNVVGSALYQQERILPNFVIEIWLGLAPAGPEVDTSYSQTTMQLNTLRLPTDADDMGSDLEPVSSVFRDDLLVAFPEDLPTTYNEACQWLDNEV